MNRIPRQPKKKYTKENNIPSDNRQHTKTIQKVIEINTTGNTMNQNTTILNKHKNKMRIPI